MDIVDELFAPNFVKYYRASREIEFDDLEAFKQPYIQFRITIPDRHTTIEDMVAEGDRVVIRWTTGGTHKGEAGGIPPTGKHITMAGITIYRIADGKIVEEWSIGDYLAMYQQLGVAPRIEEAES